LTLRTLLFAVSVLRATPARPASSVSVTPKICATRRADQKGEKPSPKRTAPASNTAVFIAFSYLVLEFECSKQSQADTTNGPGWNKTGFVLKFYP